MEFGHLLLSYLGQQSSLQQFLEQVVITVPLPLVVEGNHKQIGAFQQLDAGLNVEALVSVVPNIHDTHDGFGTMGHRNGSGWRSPTGISPLQAPGAR